MEDFAVGGGMYIAYAIVKLFTSLINGWWNRKSAEEKIEVKDKEATTGALEVTSAALQMAVSSVTVLQGQVSDLNTQRIKQDNINDALRDDMQAHENKCKTAIDQMATELVKLRGELATAKTRVKKLESEAIMLRAELVTANEDIANLKTANAQKDTKIEQLRSRIHILETKLAESEAARVKAEQERDELAKRIEKLNGQTENNQETKPNESE